MAIRQLEEAVRSLQRRLGEIVQQLAPVGTIHAFAGSIAPANYVLMDGRALSRAEHPALFALIGTTYGAGDGSSTFNVPDARGRALVALDTAQAEFNAMGKRGGEKAVALTAAHNGPHSHTFIGGSHSVLWGGGGNIHLSGPQMTVGGSGSNELTINQGGWNRTNQDGTGAAHNNLQPYLTVNYLIKVR